MEALNASAGAYLNACRLAHEATGKELYLAKAVSFANAMTVLQARSSGPFVPTGWKPSEGWGDWLNCHVACARALLKFGRYR